MRCQKSSSGADANETPAPVAPITDPADGATRRRHAVARPWTPAAKMTRIPAYRTRCGGLQNDSRPATTCHEMSHVPPTRKSATPVRVVIAADSARGPVGRATGGAVRRESAGPRPLSADGARRVVRRGAAVMVWQSYGDHVPHSRRNGGGGGGGSALGGSRGVGSEASPTSMPIRDTGMIEGG